MIRLAVNTMAIFGLLMACAGLFGMWQTPEEPTYFAPVSDRFFHATHDCPQAVSDDPWASFDSYEDAKRFGSPCPECINATTGRARFPPSRPARIGLGQTQIED